MTPTATALSLFLFTALVTFGVPALINRVCLLFGEGLIHDPDQHTGEPS